MEKLKRFTLFLGALLLVLTACGGGSAPTDQGSNGQVTITVWDYYADPNASPINPVVAAFEQEYPDIHVEYVIMDWQTTLDKLNVALSGGTPPDVVTVDMTWMPHFAALGAFADLTPFMPDGQLNGLPLDQNYTVGSLEAMTYNDQILTMMYDFDVYALYYRADLLEQAGVPVPQTWDELVTALQAIQDGDLYRYEVDPDTFHVSQFIYENGGTLLNTDNTAAVFNSPEALEGFQYYTDLVNRYNVGIPWTVDQGESIQGIKDGRIAMFSNGPYFMGLLKSGAPEMAGQWRVATHPYSQAPGSYLGGTGLVIPASSPNQEAAWTFIQFLLRPENALGVYTHAGAAPALVQALNSPEVNQPDPYFGGQMVFEVFRDAMSTAHPFPYVRQWTDIDGYITNSLQEILLGGIPLQQSVESAADRTDAILNP